MESLCFMGRNMLLISPSLSQGWEEERGHRGSFLAGLLSDVFWSWQMFDADTLPCWVLALAPLFDPPGIWMEDSLPPVVSPRQPLLLWEFTLYWLSCWISIILPGHLGQDLKTVPGLLCLTHRVHLVHRKNSCGFCANSGCTNWFHPNSLLAITVHFSILRNKSHTGPYVSKRKIKVFKWFH